MNTLIAIIAGLVTVVVAYTFYARRIDKRIIQPDPKRATPATLYMDGVDFVPTSRNILIGYHFKSIAAAGPIVGAITAANLWGWLPTLLWLIAGVSFIGWASDYSAIVLSVRNEGNSLSAIAHRLIAPRTRIILFVFIFFYLLLVAGAFGGIMAGVLNAQPQSPLGIVVLMVMGLLLGQMLYRWKVGLVPATLLTVGVTLAAVLVGPANFGLPPPAPGKEAPAPVRDWFKNTVNGRINSLKVDAQGKPQPLYTYFDPTVYSARERKFTGAQVNMMPSFVLWTVFILVFCYLGTVLPIWRFAQPVIYIGFWLTALTMLLGFIGAFLAFPLGSTVTIGGKAVAVGTFKLEMFRKFNAGVGGSIQWLWPMLFVTIACGAISGWHALFGTVGTARQLEKETDALPVGGGSMFAEFLLGLLALLAVAVAGGAGAPAFATGVGGFLSVLGIGFQYGVALAFVAFVVIVLVVTQLVFRVMRVTLTEWLGEVFPPVRNPHIAALVGILLAFLLIMTGTWIYLWQLFGGANQLMAALALLLVTLWLVSVRKNALYVGLPMLFMYITTTTAIGITAYNLGRTILAAQLGTGRVAPIVGSVVMIIVAALLIVAAMVIAVDAFRAFRRLRPGPAPVVPQPAPGTSDD